MENNSYILIAEDDEDDIMLMKSAFSDVSPALKVLFVRDGVELLSFFDEIKGDNYPSLLVLDLNMPKKNGREVLAEIHNETFFSNFKTIILSTTNQEASNFSSQEFNIFDFYEKPTSYEDLSGIVRKFCSIIGFSL